MQGKEKTRGGQDGGEEGRIEEEQHGDGGQYQDDGSTDGTFKEDHGYPHEGPVRNEHIACLQPE